MMCEHLHVLPRAGGLLDQDSYTVYCLQSVYHAKSQKDEKDRVAREARSGTRR